MEMDKHREKKMKHEFIVTAAGMTGAALLAALPDSGNVKFSMKERGYKRRFRIRRSEEVLEILISKSGYVFLIYRDKSGKSFYNRCSSYEQYMEKKDEYCKEYVGNMFLLFNEFFSGRLRDRIDENLSLRESDEGTVKDSVAKRREAPAENNIVEKNTTENAADLK